MEYEKKILICKDSLEGIFTGIYDGWLWGARGLLVEIRTREPDCPEFFCTCVDILPDTEKAHKVARSVKRKLGGEVYEAICYAAVSLHPEKGTAIFRVLQRAFQGGRCRRDVIEDLTDPDVHLVMKLRTRVWHEYHRYFGFVRFRDAGGGVLFSEIAPENDILEMLAPHFADRFPNENWMIYDERRKKVLVHPKGGTCSIHAEVILNEDQRKTLGRAEEYEQLWKAFCESVTIQERKNPRLQQQFLPLKFRSNMLEFYEKP